MGILTATRTAPTRIEPRFTVPATIRTAETARPQPQALGTPLGIRRGGIPYDAADLFSAEFAEWFPWLGSPDLEINIWRDRIVARCRDLVRNDGWASGAVSRILDATIGADLRLIPRPDFRFLARQFSATFDDVWAEEYAQAMQELWRNFAYDPGRWCDGERKKTLPQLFRLAFRHQLVDGESLMQVQWRDRGDIGPGRANYRTTYMLIDPDRLSDPALMFDTLKVRGGVEVDDRGAPTAYHIRRAHQGDWFAAAKSWVWDRIPRETSTGRPIILHDYVPDRTGQHRATGILTPVLSRMKMLAKYDQTEMQAAVVNATLAAFVESPYDPDIVQDALEAEIDGHRSGERIDQLRAYQSDRAGFHADRRLSLAGARISTLYPGEKIASIAPNHPGGNFEAFEGAMLRNCAAAIGTSAEELSQDYSKTNYSSARAAMMNSWKAYGRRRSDFAAGFCTPAYSAFVEEAVDLGLVPMPADAPDFPEARAAFSACRWMGPGRGWIDPVKEAQAAVMRMDAGLTTLVEECADQGLDVDDVLDARASLVKRFKQRGLPLPGWAAETAPAEQDSAKPPKPVAQ